MVTPVPSLLPKTVTPQMQALEQAMVAPLASLPVETLTDLWDPARCPEWFLPHLAQAVRVVLWRSDWPEATKRRMIADSWQINALRGKVSGIELALSAMGMTARVREWHETTPPGRRGTFDLLVLSRPGIPALSAETQADICWVTDRTKRKSQHMALTMVADVAATMGMTFAGTAVITGRSRGPLSGRNSLTSRQSLSAVTTLNPNSAYTGQSRARTCLSHPGRLAGMMTATEWVVATMEKPRMTETVLTAPDGVKTTIRATPDGVVAERAGETFFLGRRSNAPVFITSGTLPATVTVSAGATALTLSAPPDELAVGDTLISPHGWHDVTAISGNQVHFYPAFPTAGSFYVMGAKHAR